MLGSGITNYHRNTINIKQVVQVIPSLRYTIYLTCLVYIDRLKYGCSRINWENSQIL